MRFEVTSVTKLIESMAWWRSPSASGPGQRCLLDPRPGGAGQIQVRPGDGSCLQLGGDRIGTTASAEAGVAARWTPYSAEVETVAEGAVC